MEYSDISDVFISYRRADITFVRQLVDALIETDREVWVDWEDIPPASTDWWEDIKRGIAGADAFIAILSPRYLQSEICLNELAEAFELGKKIIPVILEKFDDSKIPHEVSSINWIYFCPHTDESNSFDSAFPKVIDALESDQAYWRLHTRFSSRAQEWVDDERNKSRLLTGKEISEAQEWLKSGSELIPQPSPLHGEYILASQQNQLQRNRRITIGITTALVISISLALLSVFQTRRAEENEAKAVANAATAEYRSTLVAEQAATSEANLLDAWNTQSLFLADLSGQELSGGDSQTALLLALESLAHYPQVYNVESSSALRNALDNSVQELAYMQHDDDVRGASWSPDEALILTWSDDGTARIWNIADNTLLYTLGHEGVVYGAEWSPDGKRVLTWTNQCEYVDEYIGGINFNDCSVSEANLWSLDDISSPLILQHKDGVYSATWGLLGSVLSWSKDGTAKLWNSVNGEIIVELQHHGLKGAEIHSDNDELILTWSNTAIRAWQFPFQESILFEHVAETPVDGIGGAIWEPFSTRILSWASDGTIEIWDLEDDSPLVGQNRYPVYGARWSPNGSRIVSWQGTEVAMWSVDGSEDTVTMNQSSQVKGAEWNHAGTAFLTWSFDEDGLALVWPEEIWDVGSIGLRHGSELFGASWSQNDKYVLTWSRDDTAKIWSVEDAVALRTVSHDDDVRGAIWNSDETLLLTWSSDNTARVWRLFGTDATRMLYHNDTVRGADWNTDETKVISWDTDGITKIWHADNSVKELKNQATVFGAILNSDETRLITWTYTDMTIWDLEDDSYISFPDANGVRSVFWSKDETRILTISDTVIEVWDTHTGDNLLKSQHGGYVLDVHWDNKENLAIVIVGDKITVLDFETNLPKVEFIHSDKRGASWNQDRSKILSWGGEKSAYIWDVNTGEKLKSFRYTDDIYLEDYLIDYITLAKWNKDESQLLTVSGDTVTIWDVESGEQVTSMSHDGYRIDGADFNSDHTLLLTWGDNGLLRIWEIHDSAKPRFSTQTSLVWSSGFLKEPTSNISHAIWSPDETQVLLWAGPVAYIWTPASDDIVYFAQGDIINQIVGAQWNSDGSQVMVWYADEVNIVPVDIKSLMDIAENEKTRNLTNDERKQFFLPTIEPSLNTSS